MVVCRLEDGIYRESRVAGTDPAVFRSDVLGGLVRSAATPGSGAGAAGLPLPVVGRGTPLRWRDTRTDEERGHIEQELTQQAVALLEAHLGSTLSPADMDRITTHWQRHGQLDNVKNRILQVRQAPHVWQSLLRPD